VRLQNIPDRNVFKHNRVALHHNIFSVFRLRNVFLSSGSGAVANPPELHRRSLAKCRVRPPCTRLWDKRIPVH
jgi:hypothetical protein